MKIDGESRKQFVEKGLLGPVRVLSAEECKEAVHRMRNSPNPHVWSKANAVFSSPFHEIATKDEILDLVRDLLGEDVLLWGASLVRRKPGAVHPWHTDIECYGSEGKSLTVWIGLEETSRESSLQLLSHSHHFGATLQQVSYESGKIRTDVTTSEVLEWARHRDSRSRVETLDIHDGDALFFDGRLWHYSENTNTSGTRTALLLQYATPDTMVRIPDKGEYEFPFRFSNDRPPCVLVSGSDRFGVNQTVSPPEPDLIWPCWIRPIDELKMERRDEGWTSGHIFKGRTASAKKFSCHVSILEEGRMPHAPHVHHEEELLVMLSGQVDIIRVDEQSKEETAERIGPVAGCE